MANSEKLAAWEIELLKPTEPTPIYDAMVEEQRLVRQERREEFYRRMGWIEQIPVEGKDARREQAIRQAQEEVRKPVGHSEDCSCYFCDS